MLMNDSAIAECGECLDALRLDVDARDRERREVERLRAGSNEYGADPEPGTIMDSVCLDSRRAARERERVRDCDCDADRRARVRISTSSSCDGVDTPLSSESPHPTPQASSSTMAMFQRVVRHRSMHPLRTSSALRPMPGGISYTPIVPCALASRGCLVCGNQPYH